MKIVENLKYIFVLLRLINGVFVSFFGRFMLCNKEEIEMKPTQNVSERAEKAGKSK